MCSRVIEGLGKVVCWMQILRNQHHNAFTKHVNCHAPRQMRRRGHPAHSNMPSLYTSTVHNLSVALSAKHIKCHAITTASDSAVFPAVAPSNQQHLTTLSNEAHCNLLTATCLAVPIMCPSCAHHHTSTISLSSKQDPGQGPVSNCLLDQLALRAVGKRQHCLL